MAIQPKQTSTLVPFDKSAMDLTPSNWNDKQVQVQDPAAAELLQECREALVNMSTFIRERDRQFQTVAQEMSNEITELQEDRRKLKTTIRSLEGRLETSQRTQQVLQSTLNQQNEENTKLMQEMHFQAYQQQMLMGQFAISQRQQNDLKIAMSQQQRQLLMQTEKAALESRLNEKHKEREILRAQLKEKAEAIQSEGDRVGLTTFGAFGVLGLVTGGIGWVVAGFGLGGVAKTALENTQNFNCTADLHAQKQTLQKQLNLVNEEINRLNEQIKKYTQIQIRS